MKRTLSLLLLVTLLFSSCGAFLPDMRPTRQAAETEAESTSEGETLTTGAGETTTAVPTTAEAATVNFTPVPVKYAGMTVDQMIAAMPLEEKIGQLFIVEPESLMNIPVEAELNGYTGDGSTSFNEIMQAAVAQYHPGGIIMFGKNITDPAQIRKFTADFQNSSAIPLFMALDEEGGAVARLANNGSFDVTEYESMEAIGDTGDPTQAFSVGTTIGKYIKEYGFNLDFAPDADVNSNPDNIVIGDRSFGSDPVMVGSMVGSAVQGFHAAGVMCCAKHFPGHGDTAEDTHEGYVSVTKTWQQLSAAELIPFRSAILSGTDFIMTAHIACPNVTNDALPASLSYTLITEKLRGELGFQGVVITDAMAMGAITQNYTSGDAAVKAVEAGVDVILLPSDFAGAYGTLLQYVKEGRISEQRINESLRRILTLKLKYLY